MFQLHVHCEDAQSTDPTHTHTVHEIHNNITLPEVDTNQREGPDQIP